MVDPPRELSSAPDVTEVREGSWQKKDSLDYDAETDTYRAAFDSASESVCHAVVSMVAAVTESQPTDLPPLNGTVDSEALETLIRSQTTDRSRGDVHVSFRYAGHEVTVHNYGIVAVRPGNKDD